MDREKTRERGSAHEKAAKWEAVRRMRALAKEVGPCAAATEQDRPAREIDRSTKPETMAHLYPSPVMSYSALPENLEASSPGGAVDTTPAGRDKTD
jgi:hypothetical protein